jgi:hypothetical protein
MEMSIADRKEIIDWVSQLEDKRLLSKITLLMYENTRPKYDAAYAATLTSEEKITYWKKIGYTPEEARKISKAKIAQWFGK